MDQIELQASKRELLGKKSRFLRRQGITPVHLFGYDTEPLALQCETPQLKQVLRAAGHTRLVGLLVDRHKKPKSVVVREVQRNAITGELIHVDFFAVSMKEKIKVEVPITFVGEAPALQVKTNAIAHDLSVLEIECLPDRIPETIRVDLGALKDDDASIQVGDLTLGEGIIAVTNSEQVVVRITQLQIEKEALKPAEEAEAEVAEGAKAAEGAEAAEEARESRKHEKKED